MAEHQLPGPVLGLVADGTGYGTDRTIWGGEILRVDGATFHRLGHLLPFPLPGGDAAAREPRRSALGVLHTLGRPDLAPGFTDAERTVLCQAIDRRINTVMTSSLGRLFDAVAALLDPAARNTYEGQAAMRLQALAESIHPDPSPFVTPTVLDPDGIWDWRPTLTALLAARDAGASPALCAARFHASLVAWFLAAADAHPDLPIVLAGGCFQNAWLLERTVTALRTRGHTVHWPHRLPPNDAAISAGHLLAATLTPSNNAPRP
jgi:hydrogenase maturation protein HypF